MTNFNKIILWLEQQLKMKIEQMAKIFKKMI